MLKKTMNLGKKLALASAVAVCFQVEAAETQPIIGAENQPVNFGPETFVETLQTLEGVEVSINSGTDSISVQVLPITEEASTGVSDLFGLLEMFTRLTDPEKIVDEETGIEIPLENFFTLSTDKQLDLILNSKPGSLAFTIPGYGSVEALISDLESQETEDTILALINILTCGEGFDCVVEPPVEPPIEPIKPLENNPLLTGQQKNIAALFSKGLNVNEERLAGLNNTLRSMTEEQQAAFWESALPKSVGAQTLMANQMARAQQSSLRYRLHALRQGRHGDQVARLRHRNWDNQAVLLASADSAPTEQGILQQRPWSLFVNTQGISAHQTNTTQVLGFDSDGENLTLGFDYRLSPDLFIGSALGVSHVNTDFMSDRGEQETAAATVSVLGNYYLTRNLYLDWIVSAGNNQYVFERRNEWPDSIPVSGDTTLSGDTDGKQWSAAVTAGWQTLIGRWQAEPYLRCEWLHSQVDGYQESGSDLALKIDSYNTTSVQTALGGRLHQARNWKYGVLMPAMSLEWVHEWNDETPNVQASLAGVPEAGHIDFAFDPPQQDTALLSLSLDALFSYQRAFYLRYDNRFGDDNFKHDSFSFGVRMAL